MEDAAGSGDNLHARHMIISKEIVTENARSAAHVFQTPADVIWHGMDLTTPRDGKVAIKSTRLDSLVWVGGSTTVSTSRTES